MKNNKIFNAIKVYKVNDNLKQDLELVVIEDFNNEEMFCKLFDHCKAIKLQVLDQESKRILGLQRDLCYFWPKKHGKVEVCAWYIKEARGIQVFFPGIFSHGDSVVFCAYEYGKPCALTQEEIQFILNYPKEFDLS